MSHSAFLLSLSTLLARNCASRMFLSSVPAQSRSPGVAVEQTFSPAVTRTVARLRTRHLVYSHSLRPHTFYSQAPSRHVTGCRLSGIRTPRLQHVPRRGRAMHEEAGMTAAHGGFSASERRASSWKASPAPAVRTSSEPQTHTSSCHHLHVCMLCTLTMLGQHHTCCHAMTDQGSYIQR